MKFALITPHSAPPPTTKVYSLFKAPMIILTIYTDRQTENPLGFNSGYALACHHVSLPFVRLKNISEQFTNSFENDSICSFICMFEACFPLCRIWSHCISDPQFELHTHFLLQIYPRQVPHSLVLFTEIISGLGHL